MPSQQRLVALDVDLAQLEAVALPVQGDELLQRLLAEVAAGARVEDDLRAHDTGTGGRLLGKAS